MAAIEVLESFERLNKCGTVFYDEFYTLFINASPEIKKMFEATDMAKQQKMLSQSLTHAVLFALSNSAIPPKNLQNLVAMHKHMHIKPEFFDIWRDSLLTCIEKFDAEINSELLESWITVLNKLINLLKAD